MTNKKDHLVVFLLTTSLFITGIFAGVLISKDRINEVETRINSFENNMKSIELSYLINDALNNETLSCRFLQSKINETQTELLALGERAVDYEASTKIKNDDYNELKIQYNSLRAEYWLMLEKLKRQCDNNYTTILYFYSTSTPCPDCRDQGVILTHVSSLIKSVFVVPLDYDEDVLIVSTIKEAYSINETPTVIIDASTKMVGLISEEELINLLLTYQS
ncbi:MAG: hypothetical protein WC307_03760 [Candidatus Nanoarchaeia archaeon]|jgi:hypothetical protein